MKRQVDKMPEGVHRIIGFHRIEEKFETVDQDDEKKSTRPPKISGLVSGLTVKHKFFMNSHSGRFVADFLLFKCARA